MQKVYDAGIPLFVVNTQHDASSEDLIVTFIGASMETKQFHVCTVHGRLFQG